MKWQFLNFNCFWKRIKAFYQGLKFKLDPNNDNPIPLSGSTIKPVPRSFASTPLTPNLPPVSMPIPKLAPTGPIFPPRDASSALAYHIIIKKL
jgi:hypothetical protein